MTALFAPLALMLAAIVGPQIVSSPIGPAPAAGPGPAIDVVRDGDGFVAAWTAVSDAQPRSRVYVARLDASGAAVYGSVRALPAVEDRVDALMPSLAAAPDGFYLMQWENGIVPRCVVWHLDATLKPDAQPLWSLPSSARGFVRVSAGRLFVVTAASVLESTLDGQFVRETPTLMQPEDATVSGGALAMSGHYVYMPFCWFGCYAPVTPYYQALVGHGGIGPGALTIKNVKDGSEVGLASNGQTVLAAFSVGSDALTARFDAFTAIDATPRRIGAAGRVRTRPSAAYDGERYLVVWDDWNDGHLHGSAVDETGNVIAIAFPEDGIDSMPVVTAAGPGRFLVAYQSQRSVSDYRIAGRFVVFSEPRHRAAGP